MLQHELSFEPQQDSNSKTSEQHPFWLDCELETESQELPDPPKSNVGSNNTEMAHHAISCFTKPKINLLEYTGGGGLSIESLNVDYIILISTAKVKYKNEI